MVRNDITDYTGRNEGIPGESGTEISTAFFNVGYAILHQDGYVY
jgi:hypothetical protein